jgi:hypothetical protein
MAAGSGRGEHAAEPAEGDRQQGEEAEARVRAQLEGEPAGPDDEPENA